MFFFYRWKTGEQSVPLSVLCNVAMIIIMVCQPASDLLVIRKISISNIHNIDIIIHNIGRYNECLHLKQKINSVYDFSFIENIQKSVKV